jgi:opacity protein-like surface antigen
MIPTMISRQCWTIFAAADGWSTKLEYRYSEYGTQTLLPGVTLQPSTHTVRLGLAYMFPVPAPAQ